MLRYGYTPLPRVISADIFLASVSSCSNNETIKLANHWYQLDSNAVPPEYVLRPLLSLQDKDYWEAFPKLLALFNDATFDAELGDIKCHHSVTEWEVKSAVMKEPDMSRVAWFKRQFEGGVTESKPSVLKCFNDVDNAFRLKNFNELIEWMSSKIPADQIFAYSNASYASFVALDAVWVRQLMSFSRDLYSVLEKSLHNIIDARAAWALNAGGLGLPLF